MPPDHLANKDRAPAAPAADAYHQLFSYFLASGQN
jgi:hypothetical protein